MNYTYLIPHALTLILLALTLRFKSVAFIRERYERRAAFKQIASPQTESFDGEDSLNKLELRHAALDFAINFMLLGLDMGAACFSAGVIYGDPDVGLQLFPSMGIFFFEAVILGIIAEQLFRVYKQRQLATWLRAYPQYTEAKSVGKKWYYLYLVVWFVVGTFGSSTFFIATWLFY